MPINTPSQQVTKILTIQIDSEKAIETLRQLDDILADVKKQEQQLTNEINNNAKTHKYSQQQIEQKKKELQALKQAEKDYKAMVNEVSKVVQKELQADRAKMGSLKQLRAQLSNLTKAYDELSRVDREGLKGKQLIKDIQDLTKEIKDAEYATQRFQRNVGNYKSAFQGLRAGWMGLAAGIMVARRAFQAFANEYKIIMNFQQANANLATILGVNKDEMEALRESALRLGETTEYTASQVTSLQTELAKLGFTQQEIINMQKAVLQFATAVGTDLASAAALAGSTMRAFQLDSSKTEDVLGTLAVATNKSALNFTFLQSAMSTIAPVANAYGLSLKDTTALLGTLANAGFDASSAATATRNILLNLANDSGKLAQTLGGSVKTFDEIINALIKLRDSGVDLNETLELTDKRSVAAFNAFLSGAEASKELRAELENVDGELQRIQSERLDTVEGSIKLMQSAWEGFILSMSNSTGTIKRVIDGLTAGIQTLTNLMNPSSAIGDDARAGIESQLRDKYMRMLDPDEFESYVQETLDEYDQRIAQQARRTKRWGWASVWLTPLLGKWADNKGELIYMQGRRDVFAKTAEEIQENMTLSLEQQLQQLDNVYQRKVNQYQADMSLSQNEADELSEQARQEWLAGRQAVLKDAFYQQQAANQQEQQQQEQHQKELTAQEKRELEKRQRERKQYNDLIFREQQKAEDALINLITDSREKRRAQEERNYQRQLATIQKAMAEEKAKHGENTQLYQIYLDQLETLEQQHQLNVQRMEEQFALEDLRRTADIYRTKIDIARKNSEEQFNLRRQLLNNQRQQELANTELTEEQKQAIIEKYAHQEAELRDEQTRAVAEQVAKEWEARVLQAQIEGEDYEAMELEMLQERLENLQQYELESDEEFYLRKLQLEKQYLDRKQALAQREVRIETAKMSAVSDIMGNLSKLLEEAGDENEAWVRTSKILALAEIAINTGVAIAKGIAQSQSVPYPANLAAVATTIAEIIAGITSAYTTVKSAKFARGTAYVTGPGTSTSDSIPAMLSLGEGVVNARGNALFPGLVQAINDIGNGIAVPVQNKTSYTYNTVANAAGGITPDQIAEAMKQLPPSEVAVSEIKRVNGRINVIENLRTY